MDNHTNLCFKKASFTVDYCDDFSVTLIINTNTQQKTKEKEKREEAGQIEIINSMKNHLYFIFTLSIVHIWLGSGYG